MDANERAEKIVSKVFMGKYKLYQAADLIAAVIREAEEEAVKKQRMIWISERTWLEEKAYETGRASAFEEAAKVAESHKHLPPFDWEKSLQDKLAIYSNKTCFLIAEAIRALAKMGLPS